MMLYYYLYVKDIFMKRYFTLKIKDEKMNGLKNAVAGLLLLPFFLASCTFVQENTQEPETLKEAISLIRANEKTSRTGKKTSPQKNISGENEKKILSGYRYSKELLKAFVKNDAGKFVALLPARLQKEFDHKKFEVTRKAVTDSMGEPVSFRYVTALEMTSVTPHIWAIRFSRISRDEKEEYFSEMLFRVITGTLDGKPYIIGFNFF